MTDEFIRDRITELRMKKGISEYKMSLDLGHSGSYIKSISSGRSLPPLKEFLYICEYLEISPSDFFDEKVDNPILIKKALDGLKNMRDRDLLILLGLIDRFNESVL